MSQQCKVMFVDDDPKMLSGVSRLLSFQADWEIHYALSGQEALAILVDHPMDIVISDMRMRAMDGIALLERVKALYPETVRVILSGQTSQEKLLEGINRIHYYISKPYDLEVLIETVNTIFQVQSLVSEPANRRMVIGQNALPSVAYHYDRLMEMLVGNQPMDPICRLIQGDLGVICGLLHVFGAGMGMQAADLFGLHVILNRFSRNYLLKLTAYPGIFQRYEGPEHIVQMLADLSSRSMMTSKLAAKIAHGEGKPPQQICLIELAALLQDIGQLILLDNRPEETLRMHGLAVSQSINLEEAESQMGCSSHAQLGGYLLSIWGFPRRIVDLVLWHHSPAKWQESESARYMAAATALVHGEGMSGPTLGAISQWVGCERLEKWFEYYQELNHSEQEQDHALYSITG